MGGYQGGGDETQLIVMLIAAGIGLVVGLVIAVVVCVIVSDCFKRIPEEFRQMEPGMVWLLLIPCFNIVWNFFVFPKLSKSYQAYFQSVGNTEEGDCAEKLGWAYAILGACSVIPCVNYLAGPASLVVLIIYLVKAVGLKKKIAAA